MKLLRIPKADTEVVVEQKNRSFLNPKVGSGYTLFFFKTKNSIKTSGPLNLLTVRSYLHVFHVLFALL